MNEKLVNLKLFKQDGQYYLRAEYEYETEDEFRKFTIPKIRLDVYGCHLPMFEHNINVGSLEEHYVDLGFGMLRCEPSDTNKSIYDIYIIDELVKKKPPVKMTHEEIREKLGHDFEEVAESIRRDCRNCKHVEVHVDEQPCCLCRCNKWYGWELNKGEGGNK